MTNTPPVTKVNVCFLHCALHLLRKGKERRCGQLPQREIQQSIDMPLVLIERDLVRGGQEHDAQDVGVQGHLKEPTKKANVLMIMPPCASFSKLQRANRNGPAPVRNKDFPFGFPWLTGPLKDRLDAANELIMF